MAGGRLEPGAPAVPIYAWTIMTNESQRATVYYYSTSFVNPPDFAPAPSPSFRGAVPEADAQPVYQFTIDMNDSTHTLAYYYSLDPTVPPNFKAAGIAFYAYDGDAAERDVHQFQAPRAGPGQTVPYYYGDLSDPPPPGFILSNPSPEVVAFWAHPGPSEPETEVTNESGSSQIRFSYALDFDITDAPSPDDVAIPPHSGLITQQGVGSADHGSQLLQFATDAQDPVVWWSGWVREGSLECRLAETDALDDRFELRLHGLRTVRPVESRATEYGRAVRARHASHGGRGFESHQHPRSSGSSPR